MTNRRAKSISKKFGDEKKRTLSFNRSNGITPNNKKNLMNGLLDLSDDQLQSTSGELTMEEKEQEFGKFKRLDTINEDQFNEASLSYTNLGE